MSAKLDPSFWKDRRVLLTGHTGFKGSWAALMLEHLGAKVYGISLPPSTPLYESLSHWKNIESIYCDIRNAQKLAEIVTTIEPQIVIHMAAQPLVRESYSLPIETLETNIMGTANLLETLRNTLNLEAILVITSDKVYLNTDQKIAMHENSPLGGYDPYSASKASTELIVASYAQSFFSERDIPVCTARAGNVIGGGDWAKDRIIPDLWRAYESNQKVHLRNPEAIRPWQHVLEPLYGYLLYIEKMLAMPHITKALNFGPDKSSIRTVLDIASFFSKTLGNEDIFSVGKSDLSLKESHFLSIDPSLATNTIGWRGLLNVEEALDWTCHWYKSYRDLNRMRSFSIAQIEKYFELERA